MYCGYKRKKELESKTKPAVLQVDPAPEKEG